MVKFSDSDIAFDLYAKDFVNSLTNFQKAMFLRWICLDYYYDYYLLHDIISDYEKFLALSDKSRFKEMKKKLENFEPEFYIITEKDLKKGDLKK